MAYKGVVWIHQATTTATNDAPVVALCAYGADSPHRIDSIAGHALHYGTGCRACRQLSESYRCVFCDEPLKHFEISAFANGDERFEREVGLCLICGWWRLVDRHITRSILFSGDRIGTAVAILTKFDISNASTPLQLCRDELSTRYDARFEIHPRLWEEVVASIFADFGYEAELTAYSKDGGVDVFLRAPLGTVAAVQVKRVRGLIGAEMIRSFLGAMVLREAPAGVYVTTSGFTSGAVAEATTSTLLGAPIELVDGRRVFDYLRIAQVKRRSELSLAEIGLSDPQNIVTQEVWFEALKG